METIGELVRRMEDFDKNGETQLSEYVTFDLRDTINKIEAYLSSKHTSGDTDSMGRDKPFFNICVGQSNIWLRATDLDTKNVRLRATKEGDFIKSFLASILLQEWMRKEDFGSFLNEWGRVLARYGSCVTKHVEKNGELHNEVISWNSLIIDSVDFENNIKIERLWLTPAQLRRRKGYDPKMVKRLIENKTVRTIDGANSQKKDTKNDYIPIYEVHGELPLSYLTGKESDEETYVQQMHVLSFLENDEDKDKTDEYSLYSGRETTDPYFITHLIKEDGRSLSIGAVEHLFEAQWMVNHTVKQIKDQLDLASKILFQTSDGNFVGRNVLTSIENGDVMIHAQGQPLTQINNVPNIAAMQSFGAQWQTQGSQMNGISEAMMGENAPSGTAWRQVQALLQESHSLFELMTENKGLALRNMLVKFVLPFIKKKLDTSEEVSAILEDYQIKQLDEMYVPNEARRRVNDKIKNTILQGEIYDPTQQAGEIAGTEQELRDALVKFGNQRFIKPSDIEDTTWKEALEDLEWDLEIDITNEQRDVQGQMATLSTVLQAVSSNPAILQDPNIKLIFNRILENAGGVSPLELKQTQATPTNQPVVMPANQ